MKGWQTAFYWVKVPDNYPLFRHFTKPVTQMEDVPSYSLSAAGKKDYNYFESELGTVIIDDEEAGGRVLKTWLPNAKYILGNEPLSALLLCQTHHEC